MPDLWLGEVGPPGKLVSARARHAEHLCDFFNPHQRHGSKTRASSKDSFSKDSFMPLSQCSDMVTSPGGMERRTQNPAEQWHREAFAISGHPHGTECHEERLSAHCRIRVITSAPSSGLRAAQVPPAVAAASSFPASLPASSASR